MFDNIGWGEIAALLVLALIIIGPERLPGVIKDVRAAIFAARRAIANARAELDGEFGEEFSEFRVPISQAAEWGKMGPRRAITKALFDDDEAALDDFDPRKIVAASGIKPGETPVQTARRLRQHSSSPSRKQATASSANESAATTPPPNPRSEKGNFETGGGFSWADIT